MLKKILRMILLFIGILLVTSINVTAETYKGYLNNEGKSKETRLEVSHLYVEDGGKSSVAYCFNLSKD